MSDIFDETEENLRADKWVAIVKTALPIVIATLLAALLLALGIWGWQSWQANIAAKSSETYQAALDAGNKGDTAGAKTKFEDVTKSGNATYKALAYMQLGGMAVSAKNDTEAAKDFDAAAAQGTSPAIKDLAVLKSVFVSMDKAPFKQVQDRLTPLTKDGRPFAPLAKEALAMAKLQNGDVAGARSDLQVLSLTLGTPDGVKQRAGEFVQAIDSGAIPAAKAAIALPEATAPVMPQMPAGAMPTAQ